MLKQLYIKISDTYFNYIKYINIKKLIIKFNILKNKALVVCKN